jgi:hypothetical protein
MGLERWNEPRREVVLHVQLAAARHVVTMKWGGRYAIEAVNFRFRASGWEGPWKVHTEALIAVGRADRPFHRAQVLEAPEWLTRLEEVAMMKVQSEGTL